MCKLGGISRAAYYKWFNHEETANDKLNQKLADKLEQLHEKHPDMGYRRLNDKLRHDDSILVNDKRILRDHRPVAYVIGDSNNNTLVFETFDMAVAANPDAHPIFHSDRGYQYTSRTFHQKLEAAGMTQSMSRVAHCTDNGPMEGFWGILKREMYYKQKFHTREELVRAITEYMDYYTNGRPQRGLGILTPMEFYEKQLLAA